MWRIVRQRARQLQKPGSSRHNHARGAGFRSARGSSRLARGASQARIAEASRRLPPRVREHRDGPHERHVVVSLPAGPTAPARRDLRHGRHVDGAQSRLQAHVRARGVRDERHPDRDRHLGACAARKGGGDHPRDGDGGAGGHARDAARVELGGVFRRTRRASRAGHAKRVRFRGPLPRRALVRSARVWTRTQLETRRRTSFDVRFIVGKLGFETLLPGVGARFPPIQARAGRASAHLRGVGRTAERVRDGGRQRQG